MAYSLVSSDEVAYMLDLHLFLGQALRLHYTSGSATTSEDEQWPSGQNQFFFCWYRKFLPHLYFIFATTLLCMQYTHQILLLVS